MIGRTIGKYRIVEQIGRGGMGTVYKAVDETLDRVVAVKMINADLMSAERMQRFRSEAVALARLNHPRIATIHELTRDGDALLMVMEYVAGETCERLVARNGALPVPQAVMICDQILDALEHAHAAGIVHRDLKPANLMVRPAGDVKVMDFGIARIAGSEHLTSDGYMMGTPAYMSPEQVRGAEVDSRMDLYAVAVVLYRLLTNQLPFRADTPMAIIHSHLTDHPTPPRQLRPDLPAWIDEILERGLAKAPDDRIQTAAEFRFALQRGLSGTPMTMTPPWGDRTNAETYEMPTPSGLWPSPSRSMPIPTGYSAPVPTSRVATAAVPTGSTPAFHVPTGSTQTTAIPTGSDLTPAAPRTEATLTLRTPHLALAATLLGLLVIGVAVLAYAALRRPTIVTTTAAAPGAAVAPAPEPGPAAPVGAPPPVPATNPAAAPVPGVDGSPLSTTNVSGGGVAGGSPVPVSSRGAAGAAGAPAPPATTARSGERATKAAATLPVTPAALAKDAIAIGSAVPAPPTAPAPGPASTPVAAAEPVLPAAAAAPIESFGDIKAVVTEGARSRELDALLSLEPGKLVVRSRESGAVLKTLPYQAIAATTYVQSKRPKASDSSAVAPVPENVAGSGFFLGTAKHWLTLQSASDFLILRLEDKNVRAITASLEARTGIKTQRPVQAK